MISESRLASAFSLRSLAAGILFSLLLGVHATADATTFPFPLVKFGRIPTGKASTASWQLCYPTPDTLSSSGSSFTGPNAGDITITSDGCKNFQFTENQSCVPPFSQYCQVNFTWTPQGPGNRSATIQVADQNSNLFQQPFSAIGAIIVLPNPKQAFPLASPTPSASNAGSALVTFQAANITGTVTWKATTQYETSGDIKVASPAPVMFDTTMPNQSMMQSFTAQGGMLNVSATAQGYTDTVTAYITGSQIANPDITTVTTNMYCPTSCCSAGTCTTLNGGQPATKNLFTIVASVESSCGQFALNADKHYPSSLGALWPVENTKGSPGGTYIGLLMDQISNPHASGIETAWNWLTNVSVGLSIFDDKISTYILSPQGLQATAISNHTGLAQLTQFQLENMALGEYGSKAKGNPHKQYYMPKCVGGTPNGKVCQGGQWQWQENKRTAAATYVDQLRKQTAPCP